jgi:CHAD domain-containing protein
MASDRKIEVEAKYRVLTPGAADRYLVSPEIGGLAGLEAVRSVRIEDRYVDTGDWALALGGFAARLRKTGRGVEIGLKARNSSGAGPVHRREEIEGTADAGLIPSAWPSSPARDVVLELCGDQPLVEVVTLRQMRRVRALRSTGAAAELSVDEVEVLVGGKVIDSFEELELELKECDESCLPAVVAVFDADPALRRQNRSKFERAVKAVRSRLSDMSADDRLRWERAPADLIGRRPKNGEGVPAAPDGGTEAGGSEPADPAGDPGSAGRRATGREGSGAPGTSGTPGIATGAPGIATDAPTGGPGRPRRHRPNKPDARTIGIQAADGMPEAARKVLEFHFRRLKNREAGVRGGSDPEELHDMRVAARRMRAAWRVFDGSFKAGKTRRLRRRLGVLADRLGTVRDLDVLLAHLETYRDGLEPAQRPGLDPLISLWRRQRSEARVQLIDELDSREYDAFVDAMDEFLESGANAAATLAAPTSPHRVRDCAPSKIWSCYEAVRVYELVLPWADIETLHELRICTKWLRYTLEFFGELLGPDSERLLSRVVALQEHLGDLHDADAAAKLTRDVLVARAGELSRPELESIGAYLQSREREVARRRRALGPVWRAVNGAPFRRALGRATASL